MFFRNDEDRGMKDLSVERSREIIRKNRMARLACISEGEPYVVPVNYVFDGENVYMHSLPGRKITAMRANPRVCLQVDEIDDDLNWRSVMALGNFEEIEGVEDRSRAMGYLLAHFPNLTPVETLIASDAGSPSPIVFRVRVDRLTGVFEGRDHSIRQSQTTA
jgi:nitroimidazol reductase NimA-like FMN-containing flavoprotein (pyridoxamine 5'-phosphate oxidase superfamily)